jgi:two-component system sensor histidine kinase DesK
MKWPDLPTGTEKPSWAGLFGAIALVYVFWDPYRLGATWIEWLWTGLAFAVFFSLNVVGLIYWSRRRVIVWVCSAMTLVAIAFTAYRPSGIVFFIIIAGFVPLTMGGRVAASAAIIGGVVLLAVAEWWWLWPQSPAPYVVAVESFLVGGAITFLVRQQMSLRQILKTAERERIARDLHDILGHTLSVIALKAELANRLLEQSPQRAKTEIADVERIARNALAEVRDAISGYRSGDLLAELDRAQSTLETAGIVVERHCESLDMPVAQERVLALVLREAVTNIVRHAQAKHCHMTLRKTARDYRFEVRDDGRGGPHEEGFGMLGIRERVAAIGGHASWSAGPGTALTVAVPLAAPAHGEAG